MNSILSILPLFSALSWSASAIVLKKSKIKNLYLFPSIESCISLLVLFLINTYLSRWDIFFSYDVKTYLILFIGYSFSVLGTFIYIQALKRIEIGILFTLATSIQVLLISLLDKFVNLYTFSNLFVIGTVIIVSGVIVINLPHIKLINSKTKDTNNIIGLVASLACGLCWGITAFSVDKALNVASILDAATIRTLLTFIYFLPINLSQYKIIKSTSNFYELKFLTLSGLFITIAMLLWTSSLKVNTGSWTTVLASSAPVFALSLGFIFLNEKVKRNEFLGILLCLIGVLSIILSN
jgi:drug/metabolite transporter (DMT)-like permease